MTREDGTLSYQFLLPASKKWDRLQLPVQRSHRIMAPSRPRPQQDDSRSEASSTKEKIGTSSSSAGNGKGRRPGNTAPASSLRDVVTAGPSNTAAGASATANSEPNPGVSITRSTHYSGTSLMTPRADTMVKLRSLGSSRIPLRLPFEYSRSI